jgi:OmpA-OmpF porin, OOP family
MADALRMPWESGSLIEGFQSFITSDVVSRTSATFGESESAIKKSWSALMPTIFGALARKADDRSIMNQVVDMTRDPATDSSILNNIPGYMSSGFGNQVKMGLGNRFMLMLFGRDLGSIGSILSDVAGIKPSTASSMVGIAGPLALAYLGSTIRAQRLDTPGLSNMLYNQRSSITSAIPGAFHSLLNAPGQFEDTTSRTAETVVKKTSVWRWIIPIAIGLLLLWGLTRAGRRSPDPIRDIRNASSATADVVSRVLPGGVNLKYLRTGIEGQLLAFIENPSQVTTKEAWFNFDRLLFQTNSAFLKPESQDQLRNISEILKAYPRVHVRVGGYTDNSGDPGTNLQLSQDRANSVMHALIGLGVSPSRITAEGYGQDHPVASNLTEEGRAQNRRVALRVTAK